MVIHILATLLFLYLFFRLVLPSPLGLKAKAAATLVLFLACQEHLLNRLFAGGLSSPELPALVLMVQGWLFGSAIILFLLVLARDVWRLAARLLRRGQGIKDSVFAGRRQFLKGGAAVFPAVLAARTSLVSGLVLAPAAVGVCQSVKVPDVRPVDAVLPKLPAELEGLRLVQISDMHVSPLLKKDWVSGIVERVNSLRPDAILFTGDMVDGLPARRAASVAELRKLTSRYGVYACVGNHEYYNGYAEWMDVFADLGMRVLRNEHAVIGHKGRELVLAGVTDVAAARFGLPMPDAGAALAGSPEGAVRILMDHRPGQALHNSGLGYDLQLSGHTHGGHMLGMNELVSLFNNGYVCGWYGVGGMPLYVSPGAGLWNGFPIRLGVPSEIALITLRSGDGAKGGGA